MGFFGLRTAVFFASYSKSNYIGRSHYAESYGNWKLKKWEILTGAEFRSNNTDQWYWSTGIFGPFNQPALNARAKQISPYASVVYKVNGLNVELGGRFNEHSEYGSNFTFTFNPSFLVEKKTKVFANLYSAFKAPTLYQLFDAYVGNGGLLAEKGIITEAGAELIDGNPFSARIVGFYRKTTDELYTHSILRVDMDYGKVHGLSIEVRQKLDQYRPQTLGQASRIQGVTPAAISLLLVHLQKKRAA